MSTALPRRPRFLASLPDAPDVAPLRLARAPGAAPPRAAQPEPARPSVAEEPRPAARASVESADSRREALSRVAAAIETLRAQSAHLAEQARADALEIGFAVARAILATEVRQSPEALFSLVRSAVRRAGDSRRIVVRVAPEDAELLRGEAGVAAMDATVAARVEVTADRSLMRGDCIVDADFGRIDGRLETRLSELRRAVQAAEDEAREGAA
ncbi:MAG TPA: FliH/SctL family protein [Anaeromyxobacteraceae bacterium]|nr:FliH/SctL family protein [Anaeromyxobacteraceae bacterium]